MSLIKSAAFVHTSVLAAGITLISAACGTLAESRLDQTLKARGTYLCPAKRMSLSNAIDASSVQARCYRDSVSITESKAEWSRAFYSEKDCTGAAVGYADWRAKLLQEDPSKVAAMKPSNDTGEFSTIYSPIENRRFTRTSPEWFAEGFDGCDFRKVAVDQPIAMSYEGACASLLPKSEPEGQRQLVFTASARDGARALRGFWEQEATVCTR